MSTIDIVIPVYNQAEKIIKCLESLEMQAFQDFNVYVVDDGSTDNLQSVLSSWLRAENIRAENAENEISTKTEVIRRKHSGAATARNKGASLGNAEFILFCDADIILHKNFLKKCLRILQQNNSYSFVYTSFKYGWKKFSLWEFDSEKLKIMPYIHTTSLIRRAHFPGFDENIKRLQDWDLWLTVLERGHAGVWLPEYLFTVNPGGTMSKWVPKIFVRYFKRNKRVQSYLDAVQVIMKKHHLA